MKQRHTCKMIKSESCNLLQINQKRVITRQTVISGITRPRSGPDVAITQIYRLPHNTEI